MLQGKIVTRVDPGKAIQRLKRAMQSKILKKVIRSVGKDVVKKVKAAAPKLSGALRFSIGMKVIGKGNRVSGIIGPKSKYEKTKKGVTRKPVKYAGIVEAATHFMKNSLTKADLAKLKAEVATEVHKVLAT